MLKHLLIPALALLLSAPVAQANPISVDAFRVRQMDKSTDVQVTYGLDSSGGATTVKIISLTRDGKVITPSSWQAASYKANTGSGVRSLSASQHCDCGLATGKHVYEITVQGVYGSSQNVTHKVTLEVQASGAIPRDAGTPKGGDLAPWDIPEPTQVQGVDCTASCKAGPAQDGGPATDGGAKVVRETDGCAVGGSAGAGSLSLLLLLLGLHRRRR